MMYNDILTDDSLKDIDLEDIVSDDMSDKTKQTPKSHQKPNNNNKK